FKRIRKYVVSRSGEVDLSWKGSVLLRHIEEVKRLREEDGPNLVTQGSTELIHALFEHDLVDQLSLLMVPVVLGRGKKLFTDGSVPHSYKLSRSRLAKTGMMIGHYERAGDIKLDGSSEEILSDAERARRERVKREG
ncbi:deaminase, partial [Corallococcus exiguus]|nr:deaminase [Corallococcus exiguus]